MDEDKKIPYFLLGMGVGVAVGILFAPKAGPETRELIRSKADEGKDYLLRQSDSVKESATELYEKGKSVLQKQRDHVNAAVDAGKQAYRETVSPGAEQGSTPAL